MTSTTRALPSPIARQLHAPAIRTLKIGGAKQQFRPVCLPPEDSFLTTSVDLAEVPSQGSSDIALDGCQLSLALEVRSFQSLPGQIHFAVMSPNSKEAVDVGLRENQPENLHFCPLSH